MLFLFASALFTSAALLFWIEPMFSKMVLPLLGGTPGVWNTCMVFYQVGLLTGYAVSHALSRWLGTRRHAAVHLLLLAAGFCFLPITLPQHGTPETGDSPVLWLMMLLLFRIGWPFGVLSATAPAIQRWFSQTPHAQARDPYFLYTASNLGSLIALLAYPILIEPIWGLSLQGRFWTTGYILLFLLTTACAVSLWRLPNPTREELRSPSTPITGRERLHWFFLSLAPSSLLLGVTTYMTTDIAAVPLLWVIPLSIYLFTFILAFSRRVWIDPELVLKVQPYLFLPPILLFFWGSKTPLIFNFPIHLLAFFINALVCHHELARRRPNPDHLTDFYLCLAAGGAAGGLFNAIAAPLLFNTPLEYPLAIMAAVFLRPRLVNPSWNIRFTAYAMLAGFLLLLYAPMADSLDAIVFAAILAMILIAAIFSAFLFAWINRPRVLGSFFLCFLILGTFVNDSNEHIQYRTRGFFGPLAVRMNPSGQYRLFYHGTTLHGAQSIRPEEKLLPLTYFMHSGPFGEIMAAVDRMTSFPRRIAVTGLGAGTIACYGREGDTIDYFEIDHNVVHVARDSGQFTFLQDSPAAIQIILGDARLTLAQKARQSYDLLIMDAFSSGAIPVHLLTQEAFAMIQSKVKPGGIIIYQISNRFLNLEPVLAGCIQNSNWKGLIKQERQVSQEEKRAMKCPSAWVVLSENPSALEFLREKGGWNTLGKSGKVLHWTDDYSNIVQIIKPPRWE